MNQDTVSNTDNFKQNFNTLYRLRFALSNAIYSNEASLESKEFALPLTKKGEKLFKHLKKKFKHIGDSLIMIAVFIDFYHDALYIDINDVNVQDITDSISNWIISGDIRFPWIFGRDLYDKYFDNFKEQTQELDFEDTIALLTGTHKGVFQIDDLLIGPYGIIKSKTNRTIYPRKEVYLWHCSDPSCPTFHVTTLNNPDDSIINTMLNEASNFNKGIYAFSLDELVEERDRNDFYDPYQLRSFFEILVNCFGTEEHRAILKRVIDREDIRKLLPNSFKKGSSDDLVKNLTKDQCYCLLLICEDITLIQHVESLIDEGLIYIPNTEIRESHLNEEFGHYSTYFQCNKLGFRINSTYSDLSLAKLKRFVKDVNSESPYREQLEWKLRRYQTTSGLDQQISEYIIEETPIKVIQETIYSGPVQLEKALKSIPGKFDTPNNTEEEKLLVDKIAWKLGFNINIYPTYMESFWTNLTLFKSDVLSSLRYNENDKAKIRSSAVNVFVSIEEILQQSLSFITWALLADHYLDTKFKYVYEDARSQMISWLDNFEYTAGEKLRFDPSGKNTLYPLVTGFKALLMLCENIIASVESHKRPDNEFPGFYKTDPLKLFPFEHKALLLDLKPNDYKQIKESINVIPSEFGKGNVLDIRNRLQHPRDDFPTQQEMLNAINAIDKCFALMESEGIYPNVYLFRTSTIDEYNRKKITLTNYKGNNLSFVRTSELDGVHLPSPYQPVVIMKNISLGQSIQPLLFKYEESSTYQTYWKNYPRKKWTTE